MRIYMKISIVTPTYNRLKFLNETILSVITQPGNFDIEYIIQDGGSSKRIINLLKDWKNKIDKEEFKRNCNKISFRWYSEKDDGMYDAINKGFSKCTGDIMAWINSDDIIHPNAFKTICQIFKEFQEIEWISGIRNTINEYGVIVYNEVLECSYSKYFIQKGYYDSKYWKYGFNWIEQNSCFWRKSLWTKIGAKIDESKKMAGDFYLWQEFAKHAELVKVYTFLGAYRFHGDQFTASPEKYRAELPKREKFPKSLKMLKFAISKIPFFRKIFLNLINSYDFLQILNLQKEKLIGKIIIWDLLEKKWILKCQPII